ncbi:hypothetical protein pdam_00023526 [Pocillopora damicornis]|uniref:Uncharacterized protein n=1 Tax=Pocillopora damicornis TaxID=46731 RepID=A0A3M6URV1_POCDA|nr:hypothetical protein pdam_00023526 [Pocillopora damicornis]
MKAIATLDENSLLAKHHMLHSHQIDLKNVEIVDRSSAWRQRSILKHLGAIFGRSTKEACGKTKGISKLGELSTFMNNTANETRRITVRKDERKRQEIGKMACCL